MDGCPFSNGDDGRSTPLLRALIVLLALALAWGPAVLAQQTPDAPGPTFVPAGQRKYVPDHVLVRFRKGMPAQAKASTHAQLGAAVQRRYRSVSDLELVKIPPGLRVREALRVYKNNPNVLYAQPDYILHALETTPNDTSFSQLWAMKNTGQLGGTVDADIDATDAWDLSTGSSSVVVGVIDTGVDYNHPDLVDNIYNNAAECNGTPGVDDDGNGYVDDCHGIDTANNDSNPLDDHNHGTHVSGTIGARGNNARGVVGVNWQVKILACKFLDSSGSGTTSDAINCLDYMAIMKDRGVNIIATNNSWGGGPFEQALLDAIQAQLNRGILFVAAAGNDALNNDSFGAFPANYYLPNVISVAATDRSDFLGYFSDFGRHTVHLGAPGVEILSTTRNNTYSTFSGTSMATPHVTGTAALLKAQNPALDWIAIKNRILAGGDTKPAVSDTVSQKRLNVLGAMTCSNQVLLSRLRPANGSETTAASVGSPVTLAALHINCGAPNGNVTVAVSPGGATITLLDDGNAPDQVAGDGIYSGQWVPSEAGTYTLGFPNGDSASVLVLRPYSYSSTPFSYRNITGNNLRLDDDMASEIRPGFPILFGGGSFNSVFVSSNGVVSFDQMFTEYFNTPLPLSSPQTIVAPWWDDLMPQPATDQNVFFAVTGSAPSRELVVEWRDVPHYENPVALNESVKFQLVFFENKGDILFNYADTIFGGSTSYGDQGSSATVGVQVSSAEANQFSFDTPSLANNTSLLWQFASPGPDYAITVGNPAATLFPGQTATFNGSIDFLGGYTGNVNLSCSGSVLPSTCFVTPATLSSAGSFAVTASNPVPQYFTFSIRAEDGAIVHSKDLTLNVGDYSVGAPSPSSVTIKRGDSSPWIDVPIYSLGSFSSLVTVTCGPVSPSLSLACGTSSPAAPPPGGSINARIFVQVHPTIPVGTYVVPIFADSAGSPNRKTTSLTVEVQLNPDFGLTTTPYQASVIPPGSVQTVIGNGTVDGFRAGIALSCTPPIPAGVTCSFATNPMPANGTSLLTIGTSSSTPSGIQTVNVQGVASDGSEKSHFRAVTLYVGNFTQSATPATATVINGNSATYTVNYTVQGSLDTAFTVGCTGLPAGTNCSTSPPAVYQGTNSTVTVSTIAGTTPVATNSFSITGTALGVTKSTSVSLKTTNWTQTSATSAAAANVASNATVNMTVTAQNGFNSSVSFSCPAVAPGITCTFSPSSAIPTSTGTAVTATIKTTSATPAGVYTVPLTGTAAGQTRVLNITFTVRDFLIDATPATRVVPTGGTSATYTVTLTAQQAFATAVSLSCVTPLPVGVNSCSFSPMSVTPTGGGTTSTLTVNISGSAPAATSQLAIRGTAGTLTHDKPVTLITGADFSLATQAPSSVSVQQTQDAVYQVTLAPTGGFNQPITMSCTGLPTGGGCAFSPPGPITPAGSPVDVTVTASTTLASPPGTYNFTVTGTGAGVSHNSSPGPQLVLDLFPDFALSTSTPLPAPVRSTGSATYAITVLRNGAYGHVVNLSCASFALGNATCQVNPASVDLAGVPSGGSQSATVTVTTTGAALGSSNFTLHGVENGGSRAHDLPLSVIVNDFHLSAPTSASAQQAQSAQYTVTVFSDQGFNQAVTLSCTNFSGAGLGPCGFSQNNFVPAGGGTAVTVSVPVGVAVSAPADYTFDVQAAGGGVTHAVVGEQLHVDLVQDFGLTGGTIARTVVPGTTGNFTATLTPLNSFSANITLSCPSGLPTGAACVFTPASGVAIGSGTPQPLAIDITTNSGTMPAGTSVVAVTATGGGKTHSLNLTLTVQDFTLSLSPTSRTVAVGAGTTYTVTLAAQNGFATPVTLSCPGAPTGVTCSFAPNPAGPAGTSIATVLTASNITVGTKTVPISGTATPNGTPRTKSANATLIVSSTTPSFTLTSTALTKTAVRGASTTYTVTVKSTTTTSPGVVTLSCVAPLPTGVTCSFSPASVSPTTIGVNSTATLTTNVSTSTAGTNPIVFKGTTTSQLRQLNATLNIADFSVGVSPVSQTISSVGGGTTSYTVTLTALGGVTFPSAVTLTCPTPPTGVSCVGGFAPASVTPTSGGATSTLTLTTTGAAASGPINFSVQGASGTLLRSQTVEVINGLDFTLVATPSTVTVNLGSSNTTTLSATVVGGFASAITLSCTGVAPTPASGTLSCDSFTPNPFTPPGGSSDLQLSATSNLTPGSYTVTVSGTGGGITHTKGVTVNVPDYSLGLASPVTLMVGTGATSTDIATTATSIAGFGSSVNLSCAVSPVDPNVTCSVPASVVPTGVGAPFNLHVDVAGGTTPANYTVKVHGDDGAGHVHDSPNSALTLHGFAVSATNDAPSLEVGDPHTFSTGTKVTGQNGFTGNAAMSCVPTGGLVLSSCVFTPNPVAASNVGTSYSVVVTVDNPAGGPYTLHLRGTASGAQHDADVTITVIPTQDWSYSYHIATPQSQTVNAGQSASYDIDLSPNNGFASSVALTCAVLTAPAGVGCSITGSPLTPPGTITLNVTTTTGTVAAGSYSIVVSGTDGGKTRNTTASLTVRDFSLNVTPPTQTIQVGTDANYNVSLATSSSFPSSPDLTCAVLTAPAFTTCDFDTTPLSPSGSTTLHVHSIAVATPDGSYTLRSTATSGATVHTADVTYVVSSSDFTITTSTPSRTVGHPSFTSYALTATATGSFASSVTLSCSGQPAGVTCFLPGAFVPPPGGIAKSITVSISSSAVPGTYQFQINATGGGKSHSITVTIIVT